MTRILWDAAIAGTHKTKQTKAAASFNKTTNNQHFIILGPINRYVITILNSWIKKNKGSIKNVNIKYKYNEDTEH